MSTPEAQSVAQVAEAADLTRVPPSHRTPQPIVVAPVYRLTDEDLPRLDDDVPEEYRKATLSPAARAKLNEWHPSVSLVGPPGTGKTRLCWAALRANRRRTFDRCAFVQPAPARRLEDRWDGSWNVPQYETREVWLGEAMRRIRLDDRVRIVSEAGDIRPHRHDRAWLEDLANWGTARHLLCVDDIGFTRKADDWVVEAVYHLANVRRAKQLPTLWTSNLEADALREVFGAAIASRILGGVLIPVEGRDRRQG